MTEAVQPKPEFQSLSAEAVVAALNNPDPAHPVAVEVARLMRAYYTENFRRNDDGLGFMPADFLRIEPRWPIEAVALRLTTEAIRETVANSQEAMGSGQGVSG